MVLPTVLVADLRRLIAGLGVDPDHLDGRAHPNADGLPEVLTSLVTHLRATAPSYAGLRLTLTTQAHPVTLTDFEQGAEVRTTLRLPLGLLHPALDHGSRVVFYATRPGAFVDLAADLAYAFGGQDGRSPPTASLPILDGQDGLYGQDGHRAMLELDGDLPTTPLRPGLTGVEENATVNRALGFLIEQGRTPEHAAALLHGGAAAEGVELHAYAARLMRR